MPAYAPLILDTTPPAVELVGSWIDSSRNLRVEYSLSEPGIIGADLVIPGYDPLPMSVVGNELVAQLPIDAPSTLARVEVLTRDEVHNQQLWELFVPIWSGEVTADAVLNASPLVSHSLKRKPDPEVSRDLDVTISLTVLNDPAIEVDVGSAMTVHVQLEA